MLFFKIVENWRTLCLERSTISFILSFHLQLRLIYKFSISVVEIFDLGYKLRKLQCYNVLVTVFKQSWKTVINKHVVLRAVTVLVMR